MRRIHNKRGEVGEIVTWVFATLIIVVILLTSVFISSRYIRNVNYETSLQMKTSDEIATKSLVSYLLTGDKGESVFNQLKSEENLNDFNGNLAKNIFPKLYKQDYPTGVSFIIFLKNPNRIIENDYSRLPVFNRRTVPIEIEVNTNKNFLLTLIK